MAVPKELPSLKRLQSLFRLDRRDGALYWRARPVSDFKNERACNSWNARFFGKEAGWSSGGYGHVCVDYQKFLVHRIIFALANECNAPPEIDHQNRDRSHNIPENLRPITHSENGLNPKLSLRNTSGYTGVYFNKDVKKWGAAVSIKGHKTQIGYYPSKELAAEARKNFMEDRQHGH